MIKKDYYFTAGELASLYGIPKQTLLYYDRTGLLKPAFTNEHGYRFYSVLQYHILEIILNLRKLDIPIREIKNYLLAPEPRRFQEILTEKIEHCEQQIKELTEMKSSLLLALTTVGRVNEKRIGRIELAFQEQQPLMVSEPLEHNYTSKERLTIFSHHNQESFSQKHFKEFTTGWIIEKDLFLAGKFNETRQYFTPVSRPLPIERCVMRAEGLYIRLAFQGTYYRQVPAVFAKIQKFMQQNKLRAIDDIYIFPLKNHWLTNDTNSYINEISFLVEEESD